MTGEATRMHPEGAGGTETGREPRPAPGDPPVQSYWDMAIERFLRNKLAVASLVVVFLVASTAVFAPLIANGRPYVIEMVFEDDYDEAYFIVLEAAEIFLETDGTGRSRTPNEIRRGMDRAFGIMRASLAPEFHERFDELEATLREHARAPVLPAPEEVEDAILAFEEELDLFEVSLVPSRRFPAFRALVPGEVYFMALYLIAVPLFWFRRRLFPGFWTFAGFCAVAAAISSFAIVKIFPTVQDNFPYRKHIESAEFEQNGWWAVMPLVPYGENENITAESRQPPTFLIAEEDRVENQHFHLLGTDTNGRDVMARMVYGARISMLVGIVAVSIYTSIGIVLGALAGFYGGWVDLALSRIIEIVICFPVLFLILSVQAFLNPSIINIMIALGLVSWTTVARLERGEFLRLVNLDFVHAVRGLGGSSGRIIFVHVLPNALGPILVLVSFGIAGSILVESTLSFLGFGVPQPTASWGDLLNNGRGDIQGLWWLTLFPGFAIFLTVTCFNLVGEGVRDALDPRKNN